MNRDPLSVAANALAVTSSLLAIGIEVGIIAGGFYIYRKVKNELAEEKTQEKKATVTTVLVDDDGKPIVVYKESYPKKSALKERWAKVKKIFKAVTE